MSKYNIEEIRKKLKETTGKTQDPDMFRPKPVVGDATNKYYFFVLPPFSAGDQLKGTKASYSMDQFFLQHGMHWINNRPYACPYINNKEECPFCKQGKKLLQGVTDQELRKEIAKQWLPNISYMVNIYFPDLKQVPEEYRNKVMFYNAPKTIMDLWQTCLMAEDANIDIDPQAFGIFFDEEASFMFELTASKKGQNNSYEKSKFIANGGKPRPIAQSADAIASILAMRHDLRSKVQSSDPVALAKLVDELLHGGGDAAASSSGFDTDETKPSTSVQKSTSQFVAESGDLEKEISKTVSAKAVSKPEPEVKAEPKPSTKPSATIADDDDLESLLAGLND